LLANLDPIFTRVLATPWACETAAAAGPPAAP
jgi:hypothetical protein